jgi:hypothetical protein
MKRCESKLLKKTCVVCKVRRARYCYQGQVRWNRQHGLCFQCFRSARDRMRSEVQSQVLSPGLAPVVPMAPSAIRTPIFTGAPASAGETLTPVAVAS